ncbi:MAG: DOMON-like domain-containing protein [Steroidobacteraceae bacterium]|jgi:hypothetical protein|nr:DOMON-like domain-containing protein [Steroidobacteraceae bacterium]
MRPPFHRILPLHAYAPTDAVAAVDVHVSTEHPNALTFHYVVDADLTRLRIPAQTESTHADELWRHTCFEAFLRGDAGTAYFELNVSPSTQWALYAFDDYRRGMRPLSPSQPPRIDVEQAEGRLEVRAYLPLTTLPAVTRVALAAIIEENTGRLSYWSLNHPADKPDFHHPESFTLQL